MYAGLQQYMWGLCPGNSFSAKRQAQGSPTASYFSSSGRHRLKCLIRKNSIMLRHWNTCSAVAGSCLRVGQGR